MAKLDFLHTTVALNILSYFPRAVLTGEHIGGVHGLYDKVVVAEVYTEGNYAESLLSAKSRGGICLVSNKSHELVLMLSTAIFVWPRFGIRTPRFGGDGHRALAKVILIRRQLNGVRPRSRQYCYPGGAMVHWHNHHLVRTRHREEPRVSTLPKHTHRAASQLRYGYAIRPEVLSVKRRHGWTSGSHLHGDLQYSV
jgi:hypothetical protein